MEASGRDWELRETLSRLAQGFSIEAIPREVDAGATALGETPQGARVYLTRLPKGSFTATLQAAKQLRRRGFVPVPHIAARLIENEAQLAAQLALLASEAGVDEVLLIAGSVDRPVGAFDNTMQVLETGAFQRAGIMKIGVAAHPEGHPQADERALQEALDRKNAFACSTGVQLYLVTQFFFDAQPVIEWERRIRARGNALPVRIGLHGVTGASSLLRHALHCGVGASVKALTQRPSSFLTLASYRAPGAITIELAKAMAADNNTLFRGLHFFPLGGFVRTIAWANALREGRFTVSPADADIVTGGFLSAPSSCKVLTERNGGQ